MKQMSDRAMGFRATQLNQQRTQQRTWEDV